MHAIKAFLRGGALPEPTYRTLWSPQVGAPMLRMSNIGYNMQTEPTKCETYEMSDFTTRFASFFSSLFFQVGISALDGTGSPLSLRAVSIPATGSPFEESTPSCISIDA